MKTGLKIPAGVALFAFLALAGLMGLLAVQSVWAQDTPPVPDPIESRTTNVPENTVDVYTFSANDPDNDDRKIFWTLGGTDAAFFQIDSNGVLEFKKAPDYENPSDGVNDVDGSGAISPETEGAVNNVYEVTVRMSSGGEDGVPGDNNHTGDDVEEVEVTVNVSNVNEMGTVVFYPRQPQIGSNLRAYLTDPDGGARGETWQWASSTSMSGSFTDIPALSGESTYSPIGDDQGQYLRVTVKYVDAAGGTPGEPNEAHLVATLMVREDTVTSNAAPRFPDQRTLGLEADVNADGTTTAPLVYARLSTERFILENSPAGTKVGAPVTAFDDATRIDKLGYSLADRDADAAGGADNFRIDLKTGQITVAPGAVLDAEDANASVYNVKVTAIDGDEAVGSINVTIRVHDVNEGPTIRREYLDVIAETGHVAEERVPTEMSHPEVDRRSSKYQAVRNTLRDQGDTSTDIPMRDATVIDTDLDNGVTYITGGIADPAIYFAMDPDGGGETTALTWSLEGPDKDWLTINKGALEDTNGGLRGTLAFKKAPDWEMPRDKARSSSNNNVYEVTLVVTDANSGLQDKLPVTVKVINSGEDNEPGRVKILNRQPEIGIELVAELTDPDKPITNPKWQWYRAVAPSTGGTANGQGEECDSRDPFADTDPPPFRYFLDTDATTIGGAWQAIPGAVGSGTVAKYTPTYNASGATGDTETDTDVLEVVDWSGGDIRVRVTTDKTATPHTVTYSNWEMPKCLRVAFTYEDAVDRTFQKADPDPNDGVNQIVESAFVGSENSVKRHDLNNKKPEFQGILEGTTGGPNGITVLTYTVDKAEDASGGDLAFSTATEVLPAVDVAADNEEDDDPARITGGLGDDRLTYSLSGADAKYFTIKGSVDDPGTDTNQGELSFKDDVDLEFDRPNDKRVYRVTITARDPSGDKGSSSVDVIVNITDVNEAPVWAKPKDGMSVRYEENGTDAVVQFVANNPETPNPGPGISYSFITDATGIDDLDDADIADNGQFSIDPLNGSLSFKSPPNYEKPQDVAETGTTPAVANDNKYRVAVQAVAADPVGTPVTTTTRYRKITVIVTNVNEAPVFTEEEFTLRIKENADDLHKEPTAERGPLYLLNWGVGIPGTNLPVEPNLDVGTPMAAGDDDSTSTFTIGGPEDTNTVDRIDGLTYELMGPADALEAFAIVPATGQILSQKKLDHEVKPTYEVKVKATDPAGDYDTIALTIEVINEEEQPIPVTVQIAGESSTSHEENSTDDLGDYTATGTGTDNTPVLSLGGDDKDYFTLTGTGATKTLKFEAAPDYENPRGTEKSDTNTNTYMVTVMGTVKNAQGDDVTGTKNVTIMVTNDPELGELSGEATASVNEGDTDVGTYTLTEIEDGPKVTWSLDGTDMSDFMLEGTGMSRMLKFKMSPDYEMPRGMAMSDTNMNTYMVTVKAEADGEMDTVEVTVMVTNEDELDMLTGDASVSQAENVMETLGTYTASGTMADMATWTLMGDDASHFMLEGTTGMSRMLKFKMSPDYEMPRGMAMSDTNMNTYMVTVKAEAGSEMAMQAVEVMVTNEDELDMLTGDASVSQAENVMETLGTYTASGTMADMATWTLMGDDASHFMLEGTTGMSRMLKFASAPDYEMPRGMAMSDTNMNTYMVTVKAEAGSEMAMQEVTVMVTDVDEAGTVTLSMPHPVVDTELTATLSDLDGMVSGEMWQWQKSMDMSSWMDITGATMMSYTPVAADDGYYLRATVTYTDGHGSGKMKASDATTGPVTTVADQPGMVSLSSMAPVVGTAVTATLSDPDGMISGTTWQWSKSMTMDGTFMDIDGATMMSYTPMAADEGYHLKATASYTDGHGSGKMQMATTTGMVTTVADQPGTVSLSSMTPQVDVALTATLMDADGSVTGEMWQWSKSMDMSSWMEITGATMMSYTPMTDDVGYYLRATVMYTDGHDSGKMMMATTTSKVTAEDPLVARFDDNDNGMIDRTEVIAAIRAHLSGDTATFQGAISRPDVIRLIRLYLAG